MRSHARTWRKMWKGSDSRELPRRRRRKVHASVTSDQCSGECTREIYIRLLWAGGGGRRGIYTSRLQVSELLRYAGWAMCLARWAWQMLSSMQVSLTQSKKRGCLLAFAPPRFRLGKRYKEAVRFESGERTTNDTYAEVHVWPVISKLVRERAGRRMRNVSGRANTQPHRSHVFNCDRASAVTGVC